MRCAWNQRDLHVAKHSTRGAKPCHCNRLWANQIKTDFFMTSGPRPVTNLCGCRRSGSMSSYPPAHGRLRQPDSLERFCQATRMNPHAHKTLLAVGSGCATRRYSRDYQLRMEAGRNPRGQSPPWTRGSGHAAEQLAKAGQKRSSHPSARNSLWNWQGQGKRRRTVAAGPANDQVKDLSVR